MRYSISCGKACPIIHAESGVVSSPGRDSRDLRSSRLAEATQGYGDVIKVKGLF